MEIIISDTRCAMQLIESGDAAAAIDILRDLDERWDIALKQVLDDPAAADKAAAAYICGKLLLVKLLLRTEQTSIVRKEIEVLYQTMILLAAEHHSRTEVIDEYADLLVEWGRFSCRDEALADLSFLIAQHLQEETFQISESAFYAEKAMKLNFRLDPSSADTAFTAAYMAQTLKKLGSWEEAASLYRESLQIYREISKTNPNMQVHTARIAQNLANILRHSDKEEAKKLYREASGIWKDHCTYKAGQIYRAKANYCLAQLLGPSEDEEAETVLREAIHLISHGRLAYRCCDDLCFRLRCQGRHLEADAIQRSVYNG